MPKQRKPIGRQHRPVSKQHEFRRSIIACASTKGGSGKTTLAVNLAADHLRRKRRVLIIDADPQGTAVWWWGKGAERGRTLPAVLPMGLKDREQLDRIAVDFDTVIIDCPVDGETIAAALAVADLVLVPCGTEPLDAAPLRATLDLVDNARALRPTLVARVVITRRLDDEPSLFSVEMAERLALLDDRVLILEPGRAGAVPLLGVELPEREAYYTALVEGQGVTDMRGHAVEVREIRAFTDAVDTLLMEITIVATGDN